MNIRKWDQWMQWRQEKSNFLKSLKQEQNKYKIQVRQETVITNKQMININKK